MRIAPGMAPNSGRLAALAAKSITLLIISLSSPGLIAPTTTLAATTRNATNATEFMQNQPAAATATLNVGPILELKPPFVAAQTAGNHHDEELQRLKRRVGRSSSLAGRAPEFAGAIGNVSAVLGRDVRLMCTVENLGQHQVAWLKEETKTILSIDTNIITTNYRIFLIPDDEGRKWVLHIKDVQESDRGAYQCQINTNPKRSISGYLDVVVPPKIIEAESTQVVEVMENASVSLQCKASGHPKPSIGWRREDGEPIKLSGGGAPANHQDEPRRSDGSYPSDKNGSTIRVNQRGLARAASSIDQQTTTTHLSDVRSDRLFLTNVDRTMAGLYICTASNGIMSPASRQIPLYVKFVPKVSIPVRAVSANLGEQLDIDCLIEAFPKPKSYWSERQFIEPLPPAQARMLGNDRADWETSLRMPAHNRWHQDRKILLAGALTLATNASSNGLPSSPPKLVPAAANVTKTTSETSDAGFDPQIQRRHASDSISDIASSLSSGHSNEEESSLENSDAGTYRQTVTTSDDSDAPRMPSLNNNLAPQAGSGGKEIKGFPAAKHQKLNKAYVTIRQTALNPYTYKLQISIPNMRQNDFGEYVCTSSNSMGTSSARVLVKRAEQARTQAAPGVESMMAKPYSLTELAVDNQAGYQRDSMSLGGLSLQPIPGANQYIQAQKPYRATQLDDRPTSSWSSSSRHNNRVVYDENYLQTIRNRQSVNGYALSASGELDVHTGASSTRYQAAMELIHELTLNKCFTTNSYAKLASVIGTEQRSSGISDNIPGLARMLDMVWLLFAWIIVNVTLTHF